MIREINRHGITVTQCGEKTINNIVIIETGIVVSGILLPLVLWLCRIVGWFDRYRRLDRTNLTDFCYLCTHETKRHIQRREFY
jgi:hypothetical protein